MKIQVTISDKFIPSVEAALEDYNKTHSPVDLAGFLSLSAEAFAREQHSQYFGAIDISKASITDRFAFARQVDAKARADEKAKADVIIAAMNAEIAKLKSAPSRPPSPYVTPGRMVSDGVVSDV